MFFWGFGALFIVGVAVDYGLGVHEAVFGFTAEHLNVFPLLTDPSERVILAAYATIALPVLFLLRHELASGRASSTWMSAALAATVLLVSGGSIEPLGGLTASAQVVTGGALLAAFGSRLQETRPAVREGEAVGNVSRRWSRELVCLPQSSQLQG
jgi:hypothetical protein